MERRDFVKLGMLSLAVLGGGGALTSCADGEGKSSTGGIQRSEADGIQLVSADVERAAGDTALLPDVVAGLRGFAGELYQGVAATPGNVVLSPYSVLVALGMTYAGAAGGTAEQMRDVLGAGDHGARWHAGVNALTAYIEGLAGTQKRSDGSKAELEFAAANQLFGQRDVAWEEDFVALLAEQYDAPVRAVDFSADAEQARTLINDWVEQQTNDRIVDLIPAGVLNELTRMVLVNAVHLKAPWEHPFDQGSTEKGAFHLRDGERVSVDLMHNSLLSTSMASGDGWQAVSLSYAGRGMAMTIVLPDKGRFDDVEAEIAAGGFTHVVEGAERVKVNLTLPRWTFRTGAPLKDRLVAMGMPTAFDADSADFTPMTEEDLDLTLSEAVHQAFIAVDEEGTEAAAATAVVAGATSTPVVEDFVVDRPFLFAIHDTEHGAPIFVGRVLDPRG